MTAPRYCFVGERQSPRAASRDWNWHNGRLCAGTLLRALESCGLDPTRHVFVNLWHTPGLGPTTEEPDVALVKAAARAGYELVALGRLVERELRCAGLPHRTLTHPAARGAIRKRCRYVEHLRAVLVPGGAA